MIETIGQFKSILKSMDKKCIDEFISIYNYEDIDDNLEIDNLKEFLLKKGEVICLAQNGIERVSALNGEGLRYTIFCQGCQHNCDGCQNPETHNFNEGVIYSVDELLNDYAIASGYTQGITLSGGDPLFPANYEGILRLCKKFKSIPLYSEKNIWLYTGYTWENYVKDLEIVNYVDIIVDGKFEKDKRSYNLRFKGSSNQRLINVAETIKSDKVIIKEIN